MATIEQEKKYTIDDLNYVVSNVIEIIDSQSNMEVYRAIEVLIKQYDIRGDLIDKIATKYTYNYRYKHTINISNLFDRFFREKKK